MPKFFVHLIIFYHLRDEKCDDKLNDFVDMTKTAAKIGEFSSTMTLTMLKIKQETKKYFVTISRSANV